MSHADFLTDMYIEYKNDNDDWVEKKSVGDKANNKYYNNQLEHFQLLRLIIYNLDREKYNYDYLLFLDKLLFIVLEENAISFMSINNEKPEIYFNQGLINILEKYPTIFFDDRGLSISNTQVRIFIDQLMPAAEAKAAAEAERAALLADAAATTNEKIKEAREERKPKGPYARPKANGGRKTKKKKKRVKKITRKYNKKKYKKLPKKSKQKFR